MLSIIYAKIYIRYIRYIRSPKHRQIHDNRGFTHTKYFKHLFCFKHPIHWLIHKSKIKVHRSSVVRMKNQNSFKQQNVTVGLITWHYACHCDFLVRIMTLALHSGASAMSLCNGCIKTTRTCTKKSMKGCIVRKKKEENTLLFNLIPKECNRFRLY